MANRAMSMKNDLLRIPGVGKSLAADLRLLGFETVASLCGANPETMYSQLRALQGGRLDRCVLYVFRCAVYFAETAQPEPDRLKWWKWKD